MPPEKDLSTTPPSPPHTQRGEGGNEVVFYPAITPSSRTTEFRQRVHDISTRDNSEIARKKDWQYFCEWYAAVNDLEEVKLDILPVSPATILDFIHDHLGNMDAQIEEHLLSKGVKRKKGPHKWSTIKRRFDTIKVKHEREEMWKGPPVLDVYGAIVKGNPCRHPEINEEISVIERSFEQMLKSDDSTDRNNARLAMSSKKPAFKWVDVKKTISFCDDSIQGVRDKAILLFAYSSGRRRSEVANQLIEDITKVYDGFIITVPPSKQTKFKEVEPFITGEPAQALDEWLSVLQKHQVTEGRLFRSVRKGGKSLGESISAKAINDIFKNRLRIAGYSPEDIAEFSSHSLRSGFVTDAKENNIPDHMGRQYTGQSASVYDGYAREIESINNPASKLIQTIEKSPT